MTTPDLNLLITLDALLAAGSVARAAQRLRLSASAMSRALAQSLGGACDAAFCEQHIEGNQQIQVGSRHALNVSTACE